MVMTIAEDVVAERAAITESLLEVGASARTACGEWSALDLAAHLAVEERIGGVTTFVARSLVVRGVSVTGTSKLVDSGVWLERRHGFAALIDRLRRPIPPLLLRPRVVPLALFEYWTHHDDLIGCNEGAHAVPATLAEIIPLLLHYQRKKLPAGIRLTVDTSDGNHRWSVGPTSGSEVILGGTSADLVRWFAGRRTLAEVTMAGPATPVQALRAFENRV